MVWTHAWCTPCQSIPRSRDILITYMSCKGCLRSRCLQLGSSFLICKKCAWLSPSEALDCLLSIGMMSNWSQTFLICWFHRSEVTLDLITNFEKGPSIAWYNFDPDCKFMFHHWTDMLYKRLPFLCNVVIKLKLKLFLFDFSTSLCSIQVHVGCHKMLRVKSEKAGSRRQCSATELRQPDDHQPSQSSICTAQMVLNTTVTHLAATQYVLSELC